MIKIAFSQVRPLKHWVAAYCWRLSEATQPIQACILLKHVSGGACQAFPPNIVSETLQKNKK